MLRNQFIQSVGVGAFVYLLFKLFDWIIWGSLRILETFSQWYRYSGSRYAEEVAIAAALIFLLVSAFVSSREN